MECVKGITVEGIAFNRRRFIMFVDGNPEQRRREMD